MKKILLGALLGSVVMFIVLHVAANLTAKDEKDDEGGENESSIKGSRLFGDCAMYKYPERNSIKFRCQGKANSLHDKPRVRFICTAGSPIPFFTALYTATGQVWEKGWNSDFGRIFVTYQGISELIEIPVSYKFVRNDQRTMDLFEPDTSGTSPLQVDIWGWDQGRQEARTFSKFAFTTLANNISEERSLYFSVGIQETTIKFDEEAREGANLFLIECDELMKN